MARKTKDIVMTVTVRVPKWISAREARREVRTLLNDQTFYGTRVLGPDGYDEIGSDNFRAVSVQPMKGN